MTRSATRRSAPSSAACPRWLFGAAILYQTALLGGIAGAAGLAVTTYAEALQYGDLSGYPSRIEAFATAFVTILVLWGLILLRLTHAWRKREHLTEPQIWTRLLVLCLPVYGGVCAYRLGRRLLMDQGQRGTGGRADARSAGGTAFQASRRVSAFHSAADYGAYRGVMNRARPLLPWVVFILIVGGAGLWFFTMPYPFADWWQGQFGVRYESAWPISHDDYADATRLVRQQLAWREIITRVFVVGSNEITIRSLKEADLKWWLGTEFTVRRVDSHWEITHSGLRCAIAF